MEEIQERRRRMSVPEGLPLHEYVNLYVNARNPMMFKRRAEHASIAVLRIRPEILDLPGVVIASGNASSDYTRFAASPGGLTLLDARLVFADSWWSDDDIEFYRRKSAICAEVLVPRRLDPSFIHGAYASHETATSDLAARVPGLAVELAPRLFFLSE
jgi:hypothetical protein